MPKADIAIWTTAVALIMIMLGIIGYLINKGFDGLKASIEKEFQVIWLKINEYQQTAIASAAKILAHEAAEVERRKSCDERYAQIKGDIEHLKDRKGDRRHAEQEL